MKIWQKVLLYLLIVVWVVLTIVLKLKTKISEELRFLSGIQNLIYIAILTLLILDIWKNYKYSKRSETKRYYEAIHEAGHVIVALSLGFDKVIWNFKNALVPSELERILYFENFLPRYDTRETYLNRIRFLYGGAIAEKILLGRSSSDSKSDLEEATRCCENMICKKGMGEHLLVTSGDKNLDKIILEKNFEIMVNTSQKCYEETYKLIENNQGLVKDLAEILLKKKQLTQEELELLKKTHDMNI